MGNFRIANIFSQYLRANEINDYLDYLQETYPQLCTVSIAGYSYENRPLKIIQISYKNNDKSALTAASLSLSISQKKSHHQDNSSSEKTECPQKPLTISRKSLTKRPCSSKSRIRSQSCKPYMKYGGNIKTIVPLTTTTTAVTNNNNIKKLPNQKIPTPPLIVHTKKPVILIDGGIHAREWISVATALYCIYQLCERLLNNKHLLMQFDFVIVPVVNVDGYEYTHTNYRLWRKTRKPINGCRFIGTDCNRNFDYHWTRGCSMASKYTFRGVTPFSEPETEMLKKLMHSLSPNCKFYLSLHSHAKAFMYPWGYTKDLPSNWRNLHNLAKIGRTAIKEKTGTIYRCGNVSGLIHHTASGGSADYAMGAVKIPLAMTMELSGNGHGFDPPPCEIKQLCEESWIGIRAMCLNISGI